MKKRVSLLLIAAVMASGMSLSACSNKATAISQTGSSEAVITIPDDTSSAPETETETKTETTVDLWNGAIDTSTAVGAVRTAISVFGKNTDEVLGGNEYRAYRGKSTSFNHDTACTRIIPDEGFTIEGIAFKKIYLWKDNGNVGRVTYTVRDKEFLPMTQNEATAQESDLRFDAGKAMEAITGSLERTLGAGNTADAGLPGASKSGRTVWEKDGTTIEVTYGLDCYGIEGNNDFRIDVYPSGKAEAGPDQSIAGFRQTVYRMYSCIGQDPKTVKAICEDVLGVPLTREQIDYGKDYYYDVKVKIEGVEFNQVLLMTNPSGKVYNIYLVNDKDKEKKSKGYYNTIQKKLESLFGPRFIPIHTFEVEGVISGPSNGDWCILSLKTIKGHTRFSLVFNNEGLKDK